MEGSLSGRDVRIEGITTIGRATVNVLAMNDVSRVDLRKELLVPGRRPIGGSDAGIAPSRCHRTTFWHKLCIDPLARGRFIELR